VYDWGKQTTDSFVSQVVKLCRELQIDVVAGPVLSGAVMSAAIAAFASANDYALRAMLLSKCGGKYEPSKHYGGVRSLYAQKVISESRFIVVDDITSSGESIIHSANEITTHWPDSTIVAIICGHYWAKTPRRLIRGLFPSIRLYSFCEVDLMLNDITLPQGDANGTLDSQP